MPGDTKHDRWLWKIRAGLVAFVAAAAAVVYVVRHVFSS
jgi:hypothetical protein